MVSQRRCCENIIKLVAKNNKLRAINKDRRDTPASPASKHKLQESQHMLASTIQLWPPNVETLIKTEEDRSCLQSMKTDRAASFGLFDKVLAHTVSKHNRRAAAAAEQVKRACVDKVSTTAVPSDLITNTVTVIIMALRTVIMMIVNMAIQFLSLLLHYLEIGLHVRRN